MVPYSTTNVPSHPIAYCLATKANLPLTHGKKVEWYGVEIVLLLPFNWIWLEKYFNM